MRKKLFTFLLAIVASVGTLFAESSGTCGENLTWTLSDDGVLTISGTGAMTDYSYSSSAPWYSSRSSITSVIISDGVTSIGNYAFYNCRSLTSVTIPNSVTSIGKYAFYDCRSLTSETIPNSVTSIGGGAFEGCSSLTSVTIPNSVTSIGYDAFYNCSSLTSVTIPNSVKSIGSQAFSGCSSLTSVTIPNSVTSIGFRAFRGCSRLASVTIPNSVTSIGDEAFRGCSGLTSVTIPNSVTSIGEWAFSGCTGLTSVTIPNSVTSIREGAFSVCSGLTSVTLNSNTIVDNSNIKSIFGEQVTEYILGDEITSIGSSAFSDCYKLTSVTIPNSLTSIGGEAFSGCSNLTSVTIPNSVTSIGERAFSYCSGLTSVTIPNSVTSIGNGTFYGCSSLTSVTIPNSVTSIGDYAFQYCRSLNFVTIPNSVTSTGEGVFANCNSLTSVTIPNSVTSIGDYAFQYCTSLTSVTIPSSVTNIGSSAFSGCSGLPVVDNLRYADTYLVEAVDKTLSSYTIKNGTKWIGSSAFSGCSSLTSVTIPNSVTSIGDGTFRDCSSLTSVTIGNSVTSIGYEAFYGCSGLTSVTIPNSVTSIEIYAFEGCTGLTAIYVPCGEMERFKQMLNNDSRINDHAPLPYTITINATNGNVTYPQTTCDDMQLTATPDYGYHFSQWSDGNTDNPRAIELTCDTTFTAEFAPNQYTLSLQCDENQGTVEGAGVFDYLTQVQISATPVYGYHFSSWSDGNTANPRTITVTKDVALTANFAPNKYSINVSCNAEQGSVTGSGSYNYLSNRTIEATSNYGYHFKQWSDGNTDNPRTIELRQDTTFEAIFAVDKYGTCGDNLQLTWRYDTGSQTLTISGEGDLTTNMRYGVEAVKEMKELVIEDGVGVIGNEAFANIKTLNTITLGKDVRKLQERVFYNCYNLTAIYNYRKTPASATSNTFEEVDKYACAVYVLAGSEEMFRSATGWKDFYSILTIGATETTVTDNKASVEPSDNSATVTWPVSNEAASYTIDITKDGVVFCRLTFNANGQLTGIAFAPGRDGQSMAPAAVMTANGLQFTVTGLTSNTQYGYSITATDAEDTEVASYTGTFTTTGEIATGIDAQQSDLAPRKFIRDNQVLILRDGKTYTLQGVEVR